MGLAVSRRTRSFRLRCGARCPASRRSFQSQGPKFPSTSPPAPADFDWDKGCPMRKEMPTRDFHRRDLESAAVKRITSGTDSPHPSILQ